MSAFNPIQDGPFWDCTRIWGGGEDKKNLPKICHTYLTMKLGTVIVYLKKIQKIYESRVKPLDFC